MYYVLLIRSYVHTQFNIDISILFHYMNAIMYTVYAVYLVNIKFGEMYNKAIWRAFSLANCMCANIVERACMC